MITSVFTPHASGYILKINKYDYKIKVCKVKMTTLKPTHVEK